MLRRLRRSMRRMSGPLVIAVWQVAPVATTQDQSGRTRLTFGWGSGDFLGRLYGTSTDCDGNTVVGEVRDEYPVSYQVGGAQIEHWYSPQGRIGAFVSHSRADRGLEGGLGGGVMATWEGHNFGFGGGFAAYPDMPPFDTYSDTVPFSVIAYVRGGDLDGVHIQADLNPPGPASQITGSARLGLGVNRGRKSGFSFFAGVAECWFCDRNDDRTAGFVELGMPLSTRFDLLLSGLVGTDDTRALGAGLRTRF